MLDCCNFPFLMGPENVTGIKRLPFQLESPRIERKLANQIARLYLAIQ